MTRADIRFSGLAVDIDERLAQLGLPADPEATDLELRARIEEIADGLGVDAGDALGLAPNDLADDVARALVLRAKELSWLTPPARRRNHLRLVD